MSSEQRQLTNQWLNKKDPIEAYRGNPLIGALPPTLTKDEAYSYLDFAPPYEKAERNLPDHLRIHAVWAIVELIVPEPEQVDVLTHLDVMIRRGYVHRNPLSDMYRRQLVTDNVLLNSGQLPPERYTSLPLLGASILGTTGTGKTLTVLKALHRYRQYVEHLYEIHDGRIVVKQIAWLVVNMFKDSSPKSFATEIIRRISEAIGRDLCEELKVDQYNGVTIIPLLYQVVREFNLGVLVVDEVQEMQSSKSGYASVLSQFIRMMNTLGLPLVVVGTENARNLIKSDPPAERRLVGGIRPFRPFSNDGLYHEFIKEVGRYRYYRGNGDLPAFALLMHQLTGGVPDLIIKLYILAQTRLFGSGQEDMTEDVLRETAADLFMPIGRRVGEVTGVAPEGKDSQDVRSAINNRCEELRQKASSRVTGDAPVEVEKQKKGAEQKTNARDDAKRRKSPIMDAARSKAPKTELRREGLLDIEP